MNESTLNNTQSSSEAFIPASKSLPEITLRVFILGSLITALLAASNIYLGLKLGTTVAAAIPAAVISMSVLRFFKNYNILENNIVQTMASAGEAVAAASAFVLPALIIIGYWQHFQYWTTVFLVILGGVLGVLISIPLRRVLLTQLTLPFPEGTAVGQLLKASAAGNQIKPLWQGGLFGGLIGLCQTGFQICSDNLQIWFVGAKSTLYGCGFGFSPALLAAGYIIGPAIAMNLLAGIVIGWVIGIPVLSHLYGLPTSGSPYDMASTLWQDHLRFIGVGTMLLGGIWTLLSLLKPVYKGIAFSVRSLAEMRRSSASGVPIRLPRTEQDIPMHYLLWGSFLLMIVTFFGIFQLLQTTPLATSTFSHYGISLIGALYVVVGGFLLASVASYTSGLLGMTNTPLSGLLLVSILLVSSLLLLLFNSSIHFDTSHTAAAVTTVLFITLIVSVIASIAGENLQDLKAGQIVGATPWKQQVILLAGVVIAALVVGPILELLYQAYGMGGMFPRSGMSASQMLPAPQAGLMAATTQGIFGHSLPWNDIYIGVGVAAFCVLIDTCLKAWTRTARLSVLAVGLGIYLPPEVLLPTVMGGWIYWFAHRTLKKRLPNDKKEIRHRLETCNLLACGLVAGAALMGVILAIPFVLEGNSDALKLVSSSFTPIADGLGVVSVIVLCIWMYRVAIKSPTSH